MYVQECIGQFERKKEREAGIGLIKTTRCLIFCEACQTLYGCLGGGHFLHLPVLRCHRQCYLNLQGWQERDSCARTGQIQGQENCLYVTCLHVRVAIYDGQSRLRVLGRHAMMMMFQNLCLMWMMFQLQLQLQLLPV